MTQNEKSIRRLPNGCVLVRVWRERFGFYREKRWEELGEVGFLGIFTKSTPVFKMNHTKPPILTVNHKTLPELSKTDEQSG